MSSNRGSSLIETLLYSAILIVLSVAAINTLLAMTSVFSQARALRQVGLNAETSLERLTREARLASGINEASSVFSATSSRLVLDTVRSSTDPTQVLKQFYVSGGRLALQENSDPAEFLTSNKVVVGSFWVDEITALNSEAVKIILELETAPGRNQASQTFYQSVILRGSY
ncbi:MAG: hypothetical protein HY446_01245 [Candidatus Niyogibacteria bacterium]|nr:hypothetical protein [Candidatus Niyogibacteria bacterium]